jgi:hypothetical protein
MDTLELKVPKEDLESHLRSIRQISSMDKEERPIRKARSISPPKRRKRSQQARESYRR